MYFHEVRTGQANCNGAPREVEQHKRATNSTNGKIYITQLGTDGIGHQMLGMYSCMLLPLLDTRWVYVKKVFTKATGHAESEDAEELFTALQRGEQERPLDVKIREVDNCWKDVQLFCKNRAKCNIAKQKLSGRLRNNFENFITTREGLQFTREDSVLLHTRGGDSSEKLLHGLGLNAHIIQFIHETTGLRSIKILCEYQRDAEVLEKLFIPQLTEYVPHLEWSFIIGGDPIQSWSRMIRSPALIPGSSSFSLSAALLRNQPTFSSHRQPIEGRYDDNVLPCSSELRTNSSVGEPEIVFYDLGHGTDDEDCPKIVQRVNK